MRSDPKKLILLLAIGSALSFSMWQNLLNNFAIERVAFTGKEIGILQSLREVPGFLAFTIVFVLLLIREQKVAYISLFLLGLGVFLTGFFPSYIGLYITTVLMSIGFHYLETVQNSVSLQWLTKEEVPGFLGKVISVRAAASIVVFVVVWLLFSQWHVDFIWLYAFSGGITVVLAIMAWQYFDDFPEKVRQNKNLVVRKRYWLFYALQFMGGARRQIFVVFAGFLMVEKFGFSVGEISVLFLLNATLNMLVAPLLGKWIGKVGERRALILEYIGLIAIFIGYAWVEQAAIAVVLYVLDHMFFAMAIAQKTYFQKISDPADIASTAGVSFTINHVVAVIMPVLFGVLWLTSPSWVFIAGALFAGISLLLALQVPTNPSEGNETRKLLRG